MAIKSSFYALPVIGLIAAILTLSASATAFAHVTVKPSEVVSAGYQTFTVNVPNEKEISTTSVKVLIPSDVKNVTPTQKAGWQIAVEKEGEGETALTKSVTWSDGAISEGLRDEFTFSAKVPEKTGEIQWKAYQTYADGTVVAWDKVSDGGHNHSDDTAGPLSVTKVVSEATSDVASQKTQKAAADAMATADRASYVGAAGVIIGLTGVYFATRRK